MIEQGQGTTYEIHFDVFQPNLCCRYCCSVDLYDVDEGLYEYIVQR